MPNKFKVGQKVLPKNERRMDSKGGKFSFKWIGPFPVHSISNKTLCFLINKDGTLIKTKYKVSFLKTYFNRNMCYIVTDLLKI